MAGTPPDEAFRITDRRRRADTEEPAPARPLPGEEPESPPPGSSGQPSRPTAAGRTLEELFIMLASSAVVALGGAADPATGQVRHDPAAAADAIDLLLLLKEKTEGNRTPRETQILSEVIYDLQLRYVATTRTKR